MRAPAAELLGALRSGGLPSHIAALEQLSYLLLIRFLGLIRRPGLLDGTSIWPELFDASPDQLHEHLRQVVFPGLVRDPPVGGDAFAKAMGDAVFAITDPTLLRVTVGTIDAHIGSPLDCADLLDASLDEVSVTSPVASPRTPHQVSSCMLSLTDPRPGDLVLDPAAGSGDRLLALHLDPVYGERHPNTVGFDLDATMVRIGSMSMLFHGVETPHVETANLLAQARVTVADVVLCQPPFGNRIDRALLAPAYRELPNARSEVLFAELTLDLLRAGGRAAMILPKNVAFSRSAASRHLRRRLLASGLTSVIALPAGTFRPHTNVETILVSVGPTAHRGVVFLDTEHDEAGALSDESIPLERAGLVVADLLAGEISADEDSLRPFRAFVIDEATIAAHDHSLLSSTYRTAERAALELERPLELLTEIEQLEHDVQDHLSDLRIRLTADRGADA